MNKDKFKKIAKYTGKTLATIACPPLGLALWPKKEGKRIVGGIVGIILSISSSIGMITTKEKDVYDNPPIKIVSEPSPIVGVGGFFASPIVFYFNATYKTSLEKDDKYYLIWGNDIVTFNDKKYNLNFDYGRKFGYSLVGKSVAQAQEQVKKYLEKGDVLKARKAQANLEIVTKEYNETKAVFQEAVDKMNSELECLAQTGN